MVVATASAVTVGAVLSTATENEPVVAPDALSVAVTVNPIEPALSVPAVLLELL